MQENHLEIFHYIGVIVGRAIFDNTLIGTLFSQFFLRKWLGKSNFLNELQSLDKELFNSLKFLKTYDGNVADLGLSFALTDSKDPSKSIGYLNI